MRSSQYFVQVTGAPAADLYLRSGTLPTYIGRMGLKPQTDSLLQVRIHRRFGKLPTSTIARLNFGTWLQ